MTPVGGTSAFVGGQITGHVGSLHAQLDSSKSFFRLVVM